MRTGRLPARTGDLRADAMRELRWAMGGVGLTADKVPLMTAVLELPEVAEVLRGVSPASAPTTALAVLADAVRSLGDGVHARMLRNSLALDYHGAAKDLTARRVEFVSAHNAAARAEGSRNLLGETTRASYDVEQEMLGALVTALGAPPDLAGKPASPGPVDNAWVTVDQDITLRLEGRAAREAEVIHVIRAVTDGLAEFSLSYFCSDRTAGGRTRFRLFEGGTLADDKAFGRPNFRTARITFPAALKAGEVHRMRYNTIYSGGPSPDPFFSIVVVRPVEDATIRISFDPPHVPLRVWRIDGLIPGSEGGDADDAEPLVPDSTGLVAATFDAPQVGLAYGVAWEWPD